MNQTNSTFDTMLKSAVSRDSAGATDTMLIHAHLAQMKMFGIRQGVEFYPEQDNFGSQRYDFIQQVIKFNQLDARLDFNMGSFFSFRKRIILYKTYSKNI